MPSFREPIGAPFGGLSVRFSGDCVGLRLVRRRLDQAELQIDPNERVDAIELDQGFLDDGCGPADQVRFEIDWDCPSENDADQGTCSFNLTDPEGGLSVAVPEDSYLKDRRGVVLRDWESNDSAKSVQRVERSTPGGVIAAAFAWKAQPSFDHQTDSSVYWAAETAVFILG